MIYEYTGKTISYEVSVLDVAQSWVKTAVNSSEEHSSISLCFDPGTSSHLAITKSCITLYIWWSIDSKFSRASHLGQRRHCLIYYCLLQGWSEYKSYVVEYIHFIFMKYHWYKYKFLTDNRHFYRVFTARVARNNKSFIFLDIFRIIYRHIWDTNTYPKFSNRIPPNTVFK